MKRDDAERKACVPVPVDPDGFNRSAVMPCGCTPTNPAGDG